MKTISKRAIFIESYRIFQENFIFMIKLGFLFFMIQVFIPSIALIFLESVSSSIMIFQLIYFIFIVTPINLGSIVQILRIVRGEKNASIGDVFNYFNKCWISVTGYIIFSLFIGICSTILLMICAVLTGYDMSTFETEEIIFNQSIPVGMVVCCILILIPSTYLYIKSILFFEYYIMDKNLGPINSLKSSFNKTNGMEGEIFLLVICLVPLYILLYLCSVGIIFLMPYIYIMFTLFYMNYLEREKI